MVSRRTVLKKAALAGGALLLGGPGILPLRAAERPTLSPDEKARLKQELQSELEHKVYSVDQTMFRRINRAQEAGRYQGHERSHVPKITAPPRVRAYETFTVSVEVGPEEIHEMNPFHYVDWISLLLDGVQIGFTSLAPLHTRPIVTFQLVLDRPGTLIAQEHCNLHGTWESEPVKVEVGS